MLTGSIMAPIEDKEFLETLGVIVEEYDYENKEFINCKVSDEALEKLNPYWHTYYWSLN